MSPDDACYVPPAHPEVAIVGLSCRFPGANGPAEFWQSLRDGSSGISFMSDAELAAAGVPAEAYGAPNYVKAHGNLDGYDLFDAGFFGYAPREAEIIDPQQRLFLEAAWEAIENAGYDPSRYPGVVGVYGGATMSHYLLALHPHRDKLAAIGIDTTLLGVGNDKDSLAPRLSYKLNLRGPAITVQTACSTSLVAIHMACQSLLSGEIDLALAGAVSVTLPMQSGYFHQEGGILSPDGTCRPFDAKAAGTVFGCGVGIVALKRLEDAIHDGDSIWAVIKGSAVNNDGASKAGFTAPSVPGQAEVVAEALANAGITADEIGFVEAHGTATAMGDPIEIAALTKAYRLTSRRTGYCAVGSVKGNLGHLEVAAGMAGLIKAVLSVREGEIPATLHFESPNPQIDFESSPFYVNNALTPWPEGPRYAGVSSFGFGGTNAHLVVGEPPAAQPAAPPLRPWQLLTVSGRTAAAADQAAKNLARHLAENPRADLADVAYTCQVGRRAFEHRRALASQSTAQAKTALLDPIELASGVADGHDRPVYFLFPGQGAQHPGMARLTYRTEPVFRTEFDRVAALFRSHLEELAPENVDLVAFLDPAPDAPADLQERLNRTEIAQPALFAVGYALAKLWESWGVRPKAMLGHSLGEYVAATVAGVLSLEDAVSLVALRAKLMAGLPAGDMAAVPRGEADLLPRLPAGVSIAAVHGADLCVVSGDREAVGQLIADFEAEGLECPKLHTSHAFHSAMMDPIVAEIEAAAAKLTLKAPKIPYVSDITGRFITPAEATDPGYWGRQLRATVRLGDGFGTLLGKAGAALLEVGPAQALSSLARQHGAKTASHTVLASFPHPKDPRDDLGALLHALGGLWAHGVEVDWERFHDGEERRRVPLPTYPFERKRYFIDAAALAGAPAPQAPIARTVTAPPAVAPSVVRTAPATGAAAPAAAPPASAASPAGPPQLKTGRADSYVDVRYSEEEGSYLAPKDEIEEILADMWQTLLGIPRVGTADNFFRLNGNSLIALQAIARIQAVFGVKLSVRAFFETPTVAQLARLVRERQPGLEALVAKARDFEGEAPAAAVAEACPAPVEAPAAAPAVPEPAPSPIPAHVETPDGSMRFSLFFFSGDEAMQPDYKYKLIVDGAKFADRHGFTAIWTPERHFHAFGGLYPNPSVLSASLTLVTERLKLRSGSVILPVHHPLRVAEEWSVVDNLSRGRVGLSFASGFHPHDFVFAPDSFDTRRAEMFEKIEIVRSLWRGETMRVRNGAGRDIDVEIFPKPVQAELPFWVTCSNDPYTFEKTGSIGGNVLTSLIGMTFERLTERIALYRESRAKAGLDPATGEVAVMIHTFVGRDIDKVKEKARDPFCHYLRSHTALLTSLAQSLHKGFDADAFSKDDLEELLQMEYERYFKSGSLLGTPDSCLETVRRLAAVGVTEVGCLLDFGVDVPSMLESLQYLDELRRMAAQKRVAVG